MNAEESQRITKNPGESQENLKKFSKEFQKIPKNPKKSHKIQENRKNP